MGKLKEMVVEETSIGNRFVYNSKRLQLAGIGLFAKFEEEREKLYQQIIAAGGQAKDDSLVAKLNTLGNGTFNFVVEESQRIFDDLVEAGEAFTSGTDVKAGQTKAKASEKPKVQKAPTQEPTKAEVKPIKPAQPVAAPKPKKKAVKAKSVEINLELQDAFKAAQQKAQAGDLPKEKSLALLALALQAEEGDVKGRRPAKAKVEACEIFDARREIKGMRQDEAMNRYIETVKALG